MIFLRKIILILLLNNFSLFNSKKIPNDKFFNKKGYGTKFVHAGSEIDLNTGSIVPSITLSTTFVQKLPGEKPGINCENSYGNGYFYSRQANPTRGALERALAVSENAKYAGVFSSGMAAISTVIQLLNSGDHAITLNNLYGGTTNYFKEIATKSNGINFTFLDMTPTASQTKSASLQQSWLAQRQRARSAALLTDTYELKKVINEKTKLIWLESPTNPLLQTLDIREISKIAKINNCLLAVDSTFCSPYLMNALELGADIVVHSATKYIGGHSDILMGAIICNDDNLIKKIRNIQTGIGAVPSPFECYLTMRGLKTLHIRMDKSQKNAMKIAKFLEKHDMIEKVIYPGLKSYEYYDLAKSQTKGPGGMMSVYVKGDLKVVEEFLKNLKIFALAVSLGAIESLICSPAIMIPSSVINDEHGNNGLTRNLVRISVGIEDSNDLIKDLNLALKKAKNLYN